MSDYASLAGELVATDALEHFTSLIGRGFTLDPTTGKIRKMIDSMDVESPWIHIRQAGDRYCQLQRHFFHAFKRIPSRCMRCWKVVVAPDKVTQLFRLKDLLLQIDRDSKCGTENRVFVPRNYGGYLYNNTKEEGLQTYKLVREAVNDVISPDVNVTLKRYCTEYELQKGPSKAYNRPKDTDHWEKLFWDIFEKEQDYAPQSEELRRHIMRKWIDFAWSVGDMSVLELTNGEPMYPPCDTYHDEVK